MLFRFRIVSVCLLAGFFLCSSRVISAQSPAPVCQPSVTTPIVVATPAQRLAAGGRAQPPITDTYNGFAWPDTPMGVIKTGSGYEFFASDGGAHYRQMWNGHWVGNNKSGSVVTTVGTLDNPLGSNDPEDVSVSQNPDSGVSANYPATATWAAGRSIRYPRV